MQPLIVEAIYENGVLKPDRPLPFSEHERVRLSIQAAVDPVLASAGIFGCRGDSATLERIALEPEFGIRESQ